MARVSETTIAGRIAEMAKEMGYDAYRDSSKISASQYVGLTHEKIPDQTLKVRVSSHDLPAAHGFPGDYDVYANERPSFNGMHWSDAVMHLASRVGARPPALASREFNRREEIEKERVAREFQAQRSNPGYQEGALERTYPQDWGNMSALQGSERSQARRALAARYEQENPGHFNWAPYLKPR